VGGAVAGNAGSFGCEIKDVLQSALLLLPDGRLRDLRRHEMEFGYRTMTLPGGSVILAATLALQRDDPHEVRERIRRFMAEKRSRQPVWERSAGCVFKNPPGVSAGKLIDDAGCKGMEIGAIAVSTVHANFFVNRGDGMADDFIALMETVGERVRKRCGIDLEPEIRIIGERP
jgi:UDP-N-acetylmuramate dehydrogenase